MPATAVRKVRLWMMMGSGIVIHATMIFVRTARSDNDLGMFVEIIIKYIWIV